MANTKNNMRLRISIIQFLLISSIFVLGAKSFDIQIFKAKELAEKAEKDYSRLITIKGERGQILDRHMNKLATSIDAISITACPSKIVDPVIAAKNYHTFWESTAGNFKRRFHPIACLHGLIEKYLLTRWIKSDN